MSGNDFWWVEYEAGPFSGVGVRLEANSIVTNSLVSSGDLSASSMTMPFQATGDVTNPDTSRGTLYVRNDNKPVYRTSSGSEYDLTGATSLLSATTVVDVSAATAPSNGQVLTATSGTAATWQTPAATTLSAVLTAGNSAGSTSINMNSQNVTSIGQLSFAGDVIANGTTDKIQVGLSASASSSNAIALGRKATASNTNTIAIGGNNLAANGPVASNDGSIAIGSNSDGSFVGALASGLNSIAIGSGQSGVSDGARSLLNSGIAIGRQSRAHRNYSISIGKNARDNGGVGHSQITIGKDANAQGNGACIAIGWLAQTNSFYGIAIGGATNTQGSFGIAIGNSANAGAQGISCGTSSITGGFACALGASANASQSYSSAIGALLTTRVAQETCIRGVRMIRATAISAVNGTVTLLTYPMPLGSETSWFDAYVTEREGDTVVSAWARKDYVFYRQSTGNVLSVVGVDTNNLIVGASTTIAALTASTTNVVVTVTKDSTASRTYFVTLVVQCAPLA